MSGPSAIAIDLCAREARGRAHLSTAIALWAALYVCALRACGDVSLFLSGVSLSPAGVCGRGRALDREGAEPNVSNRQGLKQAQLLKVDLVPGCRDVRR